MRRLTAWIGGVAGGIAAYRLWHRGREAVPEPYPEPAPAEPDGRAEELRAKLAESREVDAAVEEPAVEERPAEPESVADTAVEDPPESPEERRQRVHEEGRATLDEMKSD